MPPLGSPRTLLVLLVLLVLLRGGWACDSKTLYADSPEYRLLQAALKGPRERCPLLFSSVGSRCLAFVSHTRASWGDAQQLCEDLGADLFWFADLTEFMDLLEFLQARHLSGDYWVGGRFNRSSGAWAWHHDHAPVPQGVPYWSSVYKRECRHRLADLQVLGPQGRICYNYVLSSADVGDYREVCAAATNEHFHQLSTRSCDQHALSPLCVLRL